MMRSITFKKYLKASNYFFVILLLVLLVSISTKNALAQSNQSVLYVPLIGITSVPDPLALPNGSGNVTYHYAVKNFLKELPLTNTHVVDDTCSPVTFVEGDDNNNALLDYSETWRYSCTTKLSQTKQNTATATGTANNITATHKAYSTVVVGSNTPPPLVSIINVTKVAYPLSLPAEGGDITFTYKVNNPGVVPLSYVSVTDEKCSAISGKLGDTNGNNLLDTHEVWIYTCTTNLKETTTNTVNVTAYANGLKAMSDATLTVQVANDSLAQSVPQFPNVGDVLPEEVNNYIKFIVWAIMAVVLTGLIIFFVITKVKKQ